MSYKKTYEHPTTVRDVARGFLSLLADAYNKNAYWISNELRHWEEVFAKVPPARLNAWLDEYYQNEAGKGQYSGCPRLSEVKEWIRTRQGCEPKWFLRDRGVLCKSCRTDDEGAEGGMRVIWGRWWDPVEGREIEETWSARCDCEAAEGVGIDWRQSVQAVIAADPKARLTWDRWDDEAGARVRATDGGEHLWEHRVRNGYVEIIEEEDGSLSYSPVWDHPIWASSMGELVADRLGWSLPESVKDRQGQNRARRERGKPCGMRGWKPLISDRTVAWLRSMS